MTDRKPLQLRLPTELKAWIAAQADRNASSQSSEIVRAVRERADRLANDLDALDQSQTRAGA